MRKNDLKRQIDEKRRLENALKRKERLQDVENLWVAGQVMAKERQELMDKEQFAKTMYKQIWKEQMKINKEVEKIREEGGEKI